MNRAGRIIRIILYTVGYLLIASIIALTVFFFVSSAGGGPAFVANRTVMWVKTQSMSPAIAENTFILVEKTRPEDVAVGDIIVYVSDDPSILGEYNTHRVVEVLDGGKSFVTKGDNNLFKDEYNADSAKLIGKYVRNLPFLSSMGRVLSGKLGLIIITTFVLGILMAMYVPVMSRYRRKNTRLLEEEKQKQIEELLKAEIERLKAEGLPVKPAEDKKETNEDNILDTENTEKKDGSEQ